MHMQSPVVASAVLVSAYHLLQWNVEIVKRWSNEIQEAVQSKAGMVQVGAVSRSQGIDICSCYRDNARLHRGKRGANFHLLALWRSSMRWRCCTACAARTGWRSASWSRAWSAAPCDRRWRSACSSATLPRCASGSVAHNASLMPINMNSSAP